MPGNEIKNLRRGANFLQGNARFISSAFDSALIFDAWLYFGL
jgi:hypothetical protein